MPSPSAATTTRQLVAQRASTHAYRLDPPQLVLAVQVTVITRKAYGGAYDVMSSKVMTALRSISAHLAESKVDRLLPHTPPLVPPHAQERPARLLNCST